MQKDTLHRREVFVCVCLREREKEREREREKRAGSAHTSYHGVLQSTVLGLYQKWFQKADQGHALLSKDRAGNADQPTHGITKKV